MRTLTIRERWFGIGVALTMFLSAGAAEADTAEAPQAHANSSTPTTVKSIDLDAVDPSADPCSDFYQYACGHWVAHNPLPGDQIRWIRSLSLVQERNLDALRQEAARAADHPTSPLEKKYGDFFAACMDVDALQSGGLDRLKPALDRIAALDSSKGLAALVGDLWASGNPAPLFDVGVEPDPQAPRTPLLTLSQAGLTLPDRENYGANARYIVKRFRNHVVRMFMLAGDSQERAEKESLAVFAIEKALARVSMSHAELSDPDRRDHVMSTADLDKLAPNFGFATFLSRVTERPIDRLNVTNPEYIKTVDNLVAHLPIDAWRSYLRWHVVSEQYAALPEEFRDEHFAFWGANLGRQERAAPRWKQCATITERAFGEAIEQDWIHRNPTAGDTEGAARLVRALEKTFADEIRGLPWLTDDTKRLAERKLSAIRSRIGYSPRRRDFSGLEVERRDLLGNLHRQTMFERNDVLGRLGREIDPQEYATPGATQAAHYSRTANTLYLPIESMQPPFYDRAGDLAVNFGGMGVLAAHELTHGFDHIGSKFDDLGIVRDWQTPADRKAYGDAQSCEMAQYEKLVPKSDDADDTPSVNRNGALAVAESIAESGGLRIAYRALMEALTTEGMASDRDLAGYTPSQRFFLAYAQVSCENQTFLSERQSMSSDPRSVGRIRVNSTVQNFEEFGKAFQCTRGKPMNPMTVCRVW